MPDHPARAHRRVGGRLRSSFLPSCILATDTQQAPVDGTPCPRHRGQRDASDPCLSGGPSRGIIKMNSDKSVWSLLSRGKHGGGLAVPGSHQELLGGVT